VAIHDIPKRHAGIAIREAYAAADAAPRNFGVGLSASF
jgi:hypothetical protein